MDGKDLNQMDGKDLNHVSHTLITMRTISSA